MPKDKISATSNKGSKINSNKRQSTPNFNFDEPQTPDNALTFKSTFSSNGHLILYSDQRIIPVPEKAYHECDFITLSKDAAKAIYDFLTEYVEKHNIKADDVTALGQTVALAYERLYDRLNGDVYGHPRKID